MAAIPKDVLNDYFCPTRSPVQRVARDAQRVAGKDCPGGPGCLSTRLVSRPDYRPGQGAVREGWYRQRGLISHRLLPK